MEDVTGCGGGVGFGSATPAVCTVTGTTVHLVADGACTIDADQAGDATWNDTISKPAPRKCASVSRGVDKKLVSADWAHGAG